MLNKLYKELERLLEMEKELANKQYGVFPTWEHGLTVLRSEGLEAIEEATVLEHYISRLDGQYHMKMFDRNDYACVRKTALILAAEAIQTAAMADKMVDYIEDKERRSTQEELEKFWEDK